MAEIRNWVSAQDRQQVQLRVKHRLLELLTRLAMAQEDKRGTDGYVPMRALARTLHHDFQLVAETSALMK